MADEANTFANGGDGVIDEPLTAEELEALNVTCRKARDFYRADLPDEEARENVEFYSTVLRLIRHYRPDSETTQQREGTLDTMT